MKIISLSGFIGSGKDTVSDYLESQYNFVKLSFAGTVKDVLSQVFGWDRELLEGKTPESREWRNTVDEWWATRLNIPNLTPRLMMQQWGTELCREHFHDRIWIHSLERQLMNMEKKNQNVVISDARFLNELEMIKNNGGISVRIHRGSQPEWATLGERAANGDMQALQYMHQKGIHISEWEWLSTEFDYHLYNNSTVENLYSDINTMLKNM